MGLKKSSPVAVYSAKSGTLRVPHSFNRPTCLTTPSLVLKYTSIGCWKWLQIWTMPLKVMDRKPKSLQISATTPRSSLVAVNRPDDK